MNNGYNRNAGYQRNGSSRSSGGYSQREGSRRSDSYSRGGYSQGYSRPSGGYSRSGYTDSSRSRSSDSYSRSGYSQGGNRRPSGGYSPSSGTRPRQTRPGSGNSGNGYSQRKPARPSGNDSRRGGTSPRGGYRPTRDDEEKLPISVFIGIGVTAVAVIALVISISINSGKSKNRRTDYDDSVASQSDSSAATIVEIPEDETDPSDEASSKMETQSFVGTWYKNDVSASQRATFAVTMQYEDGFEFRLEIHNGDETAVISDTAFYTDETHAEYTTKKKKKLTFERGADFVTISHTGTNSSFGIRDQFTIDGTFTELEPAYSEDTTTTTTTAPAEKVTYDYNIYKSDATVQALSSTLSSEDYALYKDMMKNGLKSPINYERTTDKNGKLVNVDAELNAVKYYAHLNSNGYDMIFICSDNANIYLLFYNSEEIIYYTNDKNYSSKMPSSFQAVAKAKDIKPTFR